jgi:tripartite-type tricarboxylate transporter receptor subunit TctC
VPTLKEQGIDVTTGVNRGVFAPKGTPKKILMAFEEAFMKTMNEPLVQKDLDAKGVIIQYMGQKEYNAYLKENMKTITTAAKSVGLYMRK